MAPLFNFHRFSSPSKSNHLPPPTGLTSHTHIPNWARMATAKQIAANRRNSQKSTGPNSAEGKQATSQNNFRHGLRGKFRVLDDIENPYEYEAFLDRLIADEKPVGEAELCLVVKMAESTWLSKRAVRMQNLCFAREAGQDHKPTGGMAVSLDHKQLETCLRYQAAHDRAYARASSELQKRKKERRLAEIGFERQERKRNEESRAQAEENRKFEKHAVAMKLVHARKQREEIKLANLIADSLPPDFDPSSLNSLLSAAQTESGS